MSPPSRRRHPIRPRRPAHNRADEPPLVHARGLACPAGHRRGHDDRERGAADPGQGPARLGERTAVDRRRVRLAFAALSCWRARSPTRSGRHRALARPRAVFLAVGSLAAPTLTRTPAELIAARAVMGTDRVDHPGHAVHPRRRLHRSRRAGQGDRHLVRGQRARRGDRPGGGRRRAARALRLGLDLPRQPAAYRARPGRRSLAGTCVAGTAGQAARPGGRACCRSPRSPMLDLGR